MTNKRIERAVAAILRISIGFNVLTIICTGLVPTAAQDITYSGAPVPSSESLKHDPNAFFIYGSNVNFTFPPEAIGRQNSVKIKNLHLSEESSNEIRHVVANDDAVLGVAGPGDLRRVSPSGVEIVLIKYSQLKRMLTEPYRGPFCCPGSPFTSGNTFKPSLECPYPNALRRSLWSSKAGSDIPMQGADEGQPSKFDDEEIYSHPVGLAGTPESEEEATFTVRDSGIYFLVIANCGPLSEMTFYGIISVSNAYGKLPGYEYSGLIFGLSCVAAYLALTLVWGCWLLKQKRNLIAYHYCLAAVSVLGLLESGIQFWSLYYWNAHGRSTTLFFASIAFYVLKNISAYVLILLGALGWSITKPSLERKTVFKIQMIVLAYIIFDSIRQLSSEYDNISFSLLRGLAVLLPISILNVIVFYWIFSSLHENIELLTREKQYEKLSIYRRLFLVLLAGLFFATLLLIVQLYAASWEPTDRWQHQAALADWLPRVIFFLLLTAMMVIWRPHANSRRLAYFTEIGDTDEIYSASQGRNVAQGTPPVWAEELDFQDHFSEEDCEEGGLANLKLETHTPTFSSVPVARSGRAATPAIGPIVEMGVVRNGQPVVPGTDHGAAGPAYIVGRSHLFQGEIINGEATFEENPVPLHIQH